MILKNRNKLVRDKIPEIIKLNEGKRSITHVANDEEYWRKIKEKLQEEVKEFLESEAMEECVDILEVIDAICDYKNFSKEKLIALKSKKYEERGGFKKRIILEKI